MSNCEWMFGDAATGLLGINAMCTLNPLRWTGAVAFDQAIEELSKINESGSRPIICKVPAGISSKEHRFETTQEAIDFLKDNDPKRMDLRKKVEKAKEQLEEAKRILEDDIESEKVAATALKEALVAAGKVEEHTNTVQSEWMFGDAGTGALSILNPMRWSGRQTLATTVNTLNAMVKYAEEQGEAQRPIIVRIPPGLAGKIDKFENYSAAVDFLMKDIKELEPDSPLTILEDADLRAKEQLRDARERLDEAKKAADDAEKEAAEPDDAEKEAAEAGA